MDEVSFDNESYEDISSRPLSTSNSTEGSDEEGVLDVEEEDDNQNSFTNSSSCINDMESSRNDVDNTNHTKHLNQLRTARFIEPHKWPRGTTLITGDSILNNIQEDRISKNRRVKVRAFPGATIEDMYDYLTPLLKKEPSNIILHVGSNNSTSEDPQTIFDKLLLLKMHIQVILPNTVIWLSTPTLRMDNPKAGFVLRQVADKMLALDINLVNNDKIDASCVGRAGLHLNMRGAGKLATNFISELKRL